jgi:nickel/cobalt transporter (NiCoT) family protein
MGRSVFPSPFDDQPSLIKIKTAITYAFLIAANIAAWTWALIAFVDRPVLLGTAFLAYMFGLRHAFDADHIAAIDNVVRKLMQEGKQAFSAGFYFSLGHATIVILATIAVAITAAAVQDRFTSFREAAAIIGTSISAIFLLVIAAANVFIFRNIARSFQRLRRGERLDWHHDGLLHGSHGLLQRMLAPSLRWISRSWHMYPLGFLFGLGFDTATEIGLLGISASQAMDGLSLGGVLIFPALFAASMTLADTTDSVLMVRVYGWAFIDPARKLWYNLTITGASIAAALFIGGVEAAGLFAEKLNLDGSFWQAVVGLNKSLANFGFAVIGIFAASWLLSAVIYRWIGYEGRLQTNARRNAQ